MKKLQGISAAGGIAIGKIRYISHKKKFISKDTVTDACAEVARFEAAKGTALAQLQHLYKQSAKRVGKEHAALFDAHAMLLEDEGFLRGVLEEIQVHKKNAEYAVSKTGKAYVDRFLSMKDEYIRARAADIEAVTEQVLQILQGGQAGVEQEYGELIKTGGAPILLASDNLTAAELILLDEVPISALILKEGNAGSHVVILAKNLNIPVLLGINVPLDADGKIGIVDGFEGVLYLEPGKETLDQMQKQQKEEKEKYERMKELKNQETITLDGQKLSLFANISSLKELESVLENGAEGIGLFRSEFLYMEKDHWPTEEEQFVVYRTLAEKMNGKKVVIRTFDLGADKATSYYKPKAEENPAMGIRGIRLSLERPELFKTQLRALYRAGIFGNIAILFPMISSIEEVHQIKGIVADVKEELKEARISYKELELGVMIETPAAVMIGEELACEVDFFSIGTNDLTQYTLALDRQNPGILRFNAHHPAVLRMIERTAANAHKHGIPVGICGELGADMTLLSWFVKTGIDTLSVSPSRILPIREKICKMSAR